MKNVRNLIAQMRDEVQTIAVQFKDCTGKGFGKHYTYKTTDLSIQAGDEVVVDAVSTGLTVVVVAEAHGMLKLDPDANFAYKWIVGKVDREQYEAFLEREDEAAKELARLQQKAAKSDAVKMARKALGLKKGESCEELDALIAKIAAK